MGVDALTKMSKEHNEYRELIGKVAALKSKDIRQNRAASLELIKRLRELEKLYGDQIGMIPDLLKMQMKSVETNSKANVANAKTVKAASEAMQSFGSNIEHSDRVIKTWMGSIKKSTQEYQKAMQDSIRNLGTKLMSGITADLKKVPGIAGARRQAGVEHYNATQIALMGLSQQEGLRFQSANREAINAVTRFGQQGDIVADGRMGNWMRDLGRSGLVGQDAANFLAGNMNAAYRTGQGFDDAQNERMRDNAERMQQLFNYENIQEASNAWNDYATQIYNVQKFNRINQIQDKQQRDAELQNLNDEMRARMDLIKSMGLEVDYLKQMQNTRFNNQFKSFGDQIRQMVYARAAAHSVKDLAGLSDREAKIFAIGATEDNPEFADVHEKVNVARQKTQENARAEFRRTGDIAAMTPVGAWAAYDALWAQTGAESTQESTTAFNAGTAKANAQGNATANQIADMLNINQRKLSDSAENASGKLENLAMAASRLASGASGSMVGGIVTGVAAGLTNILGIMLLGRFGGAKSITRLIRGGKGAAQPGMISTMFNKIPKKGKVGLAAGAVGLLAMGMTGAASADTLSDQSSLDQSSLIPSDVAVLAAPTTSAVANTPENPSGSGINLATEIASGIGIKRLIGGAKGGVAGLLGSVTLGLAADHFGTDTKTGAAFDVGGSALSGAGMGALVGSVVPVIGTTVGAVVGGIIGTGQGLWSNRETLFGQPNAPQTSGANITSAYDAANGIQRDANGRPIAGVDSNREVLEEIAKNTGSQVAIAQQAHTETKQFRETQSAIAAARGLHDNAMASLDAALAQAMT